MAIGSIINLGGGGSISGAKGVIICDTSTFSVGDTIRVRDVYDSQNVQNKQVVIVGAPVIFEVEPYCYYKICMVQTINDVETEIGGVYSTIDLGQTIYVDILDKTTLGGIQGILNSHTETNFINIGDEVNVRMLDSNLQPFNWVMQVGAINLFSPHEIILVSKNIYSKRIFNATETEYAYSSLRTYVQSLYDNIVDLDKPYLKDMSRQCFHRSNYYIAYTDKIWIPSFYEIFGSNPPAGGVTPTILNKQFPIFTTQNNRIRTYNGTSNNWWTTDFRQANDAIWSVDTSGGYQQKGWTDSSIGVLPCFHLLADS